MGRFVNMLKAVDELGEKYFSGAGGLCDWTGKDLPERFIYILAASHGGPKPDEVWGGVRCSDFHT